MLHVCASVVTLLAATVLCVLPVTAETIPCETYGYNASCPAPTIRNISSMNISQAIEWDTAYVVPPEDNCSNYRNPTNAFVRTCNWTLSCRQPLVPTANVTLNFMNFSLTAATDTVNFQSVVELEILQLGVTGNVMRTAYTQSRTIPSTKFVAFSGTSGVGPLLPITHRWDQKALVRAKIYTPPAFNRSDQTDISFASSLHFECDRMCVKPYRNLTCPAYVIKNITDQYFNGSWYPNKFNKTLALDWYTEYNKTIDSDDCNAPESAVDPNPNNQFNRTCNWTMACNIPNVTNGSVSFYNLTVSLSTPTYRSDTQLFMNLLMYRDNNFSAPELMFAMYNRSILAFRTPAADGRDYNFVFPTAQNRIPNVDLGAPYFLTSNWREKAHLVASIFTLDASNIPFQTDIGINTSFYFECVQLVVNVTVYEDSEFGALGITLGIPLALILLLICLGCLNYKYPELFKCGKGKKDGDDNFENDEAILAAARAKREGRDLAKPMIDFQDKAGMQTWLDQAEDVVEDLNKNCVYLEEAKKDSEMQKFDILEGGGNAKPDMAAHKDGYIGGRQLYAVGGASGGVKVIDHRPTMQTKGGGEDDVVL